MLKYPSPTWQMQLFDLFHRDWIGSVHFIASHYFFIPCLETLKPKVVVIYSLFNMQHLIITADAGSLVWWQGGISVIICFIVWYKLCTVRTTWTLLLPSNGNSREVVQLDANIGAVLVIASLSNCLDLIGNWSGWSGYWQIFFQLPDLLPYIPIYLVVWLAVALISCGCANKHTRTFQLEVQLLAWS